MSESVVSWRGNKLDWTELSPAGITFSVPDSTANTDDNLREDILSVTRDGDSVKVNTTVGTFTFRMSSLS